MQSSSSASSSAITPVMEETKLTDLRVLIKSKKNGANSKNKWLEILKIFLRTVFSILLGDPTAILASTLAHLVTEGFLH